MKGRARAGDPRCSRILIAGLLCCFLGGIASASSVSSGVPLAGNVHRLAQSRYDRGAVPVSTSLKTLELILQRRPATEIALAAFLAAQQDPHDALYHEWLSPAQFAAQFGADAGDIATLSRWLRAQGFQVDGPNPGGTRLVFHGTAGQVDAAFHTAIHYYEIDGTLHYANASAPSVPQEFLPLIRGIRGLHDFAPHAGAQVRAPAGSPSHAAALPQWQSSPGHDYVGPADFATIYDLTPLYDDALTGSGVTIAIVAQSDFDVTIPQAYWQALGVAAGQKISALHVPNGAAPGRTGDGNEDEVYLDLEIAGGLAPGAHLVVISDTNAVNAAEYAIDQNLAAILNVSFGSCEAADGTTNAAVDELWQQGVAEGMTIVVSAGDAGDADCDAGRSFTQGLGTIDGLAVNGLASSPSALAVGGTDFDPTHAQDWGTTNTAGTLANAESYLAEMVWNDSCTNAIYAQENGYSSALGFCNATILSGGVPNPFLQIAASSGGLSSCATQTAAGACVSGYEAPAWQSGVAGIGTATVRTLPDVAMLATSWLLCSYESASDPCNPGAGHFLVGGGTSAAAPAVSAILALLDQSKIDAGNVDGRQGLVAPMLYSLASLEYGTAAAPNAAGLSQCNSSQGPAGAASCVFHDITVGTNSVPCRVAAYLGPPAGSLPAGGCASANGDAFGILSTAGAAAYVAGSGYDLASGLGSLDAANLVGVLRSPAPPASVSATSAATSITVTWTASARASGYDIYLGTASGQEARTPVQTSIAGTSATLKGLAYGTTYYVTVTADSAYGSSAVSNEAQATTVPAPPSAVNASAAGGTITLSWDASSGATGYSVLQMSATGDTAATPIKTGLTSTTYAVSGLAPGTAYSFSVLADNAAGSSTASPPASAVLPPEAPTNLAATPGNGSASLSWNSAPGANTYAIYAGTSPGGETSTPVASGVTTTTSTVTGLASGTAYYFRVVAVNSGGSSPASNEVSATPTSAGKGGGGGLDAWDLVALLGLVACRPRRAAQRVPRITSDNTR